MSEKKFHLRVHNSPQLVSVMIEITLAEAHRIFVKTYLLILSFRQCLYLKCKFCVFAP
jgi:hypothetical protein